MPTEVISTLKTSGGDYTTFVAWEAAKQSGTWVTDDEIAVLECYLGDYTTHGGGIDTIPSDRIRGWTDVDITHRPTVRAHSTALHGGVFGQGFTLTGTTQPIEFCRYENLVFNYFLLETMNIDGTVSITISDCLVDSNVAKGVAVLNGVCDLTVINTIIRNSTDRNINGGSSTTAEFLNCMSINSTSHGIVNVIAKNCISVDSGGSDFIVLSGSSNNYSEDATGDLTGLSLALGVDFTDYTGGDHTVPTGSALIDAGVDLSGDFTLDIVGTVRG